MVKRKKIKYKRLIKSAAFAKWYVIASLSVLAITTIIWAAFTSHIHASNADQLVNVFLFENAATFQEAIFPAAHTFLFKWPLFLLVALFGATPLAFIIFTVATTLVTIGLLAYILYRIEKRPLIFGTWCLALASVLLLIPPQPVSGVALPVNMAMLTTRNLEYILYIIIIAIFARQPHLKSKLFWLGTGLLVLLSVSDNLFVYLSIGGASLAALTYFGAKRPDIVKLSAMWLLAGCIASILTLGLLWVLRSTGINLGSEPGAGPYGLVTTFKEFGIGSVYAVLSLLTNFGANPAFDATVIKNIPGNAFGRLIHPGGIAYLVNIALFIGGIYAAYRLMHATFLPKKNRKIKMKSKLFLALMLVWATIAALVVFVVSNHHYPVDTRYVGISLFTLFICGAVYVSYKKYTPHTIVKVGTVLCAAILSGLVATVNMHSNSARAISHTDSRNSLVASALANHKVATLVADYWRAMPIKLKMGNQNKMITMPLANCQGARHVLSSTQWQPDLRSHSFAYLLTLDNHYPDSPACTIEQIVKHYGQPNDTALIAGTPTEPKELLLFFDRGTEQSHSEKDTDVKKIASPIAMDKVLGVCDGPTIMNIVAHQDDDLLFTSPDLLRSIRAGHCIRTVYITAGDAGNGPFYWLKREQGSEAAYSHMLGSHAIWSHRVVQLADHHFVTIANPKDNNKISLIFMHLPDGEPTGKGFSTSHYESQHKLLTEQMQVIHSVTGDSSYTTSQLATSLFNLMQTYKPNEIRTQANFTGEHYTDHSDHMAVSHLAAQAHALYKTTADVPLVRYIGYPIHEMPQNITDEDIAAKQAAFLQYAAYDSSVCQSADECDATATYNSYLRRQYKDHR